MTSDASTVTTSDPLLVYGTTWCSDCKRSKQFLGEQRVPYTYVDVDDDAAGLAVVEHHNAGKRIIPTIVFPDGRVLVEPSNAELAAALGITSTGSRSFYDLIVVGSGPAGLTAALYAAREGMDVLVLERSAVGGQAGVTERLDNLPGFPEGISGSEFAGRMRRQAERFGVEIATAVEVVEIAVDGHVRVVRTAAGEEYRSYAVLLALGSTYRRLGIEGEDDFIGAGVHFCATCDGPFYRDGTVLVVGGGNSAGEEGLFLTRFARQVVLVTRGEALTASRTVADKVLHHPRVEVRPRTVPTAFHGSDGRLRSVVLEGPEGRIEEPFDGVFVFVGLQPNTGLVRGLIDLDPYGFVVTDGTLATSVPGIYAAGDVRQGSTKQAASAAGEGATAALAIRRYVEPLASGLPDRAMVEEAVD
jgi:thioredoxin reductase (NADPH)